MACTLPCSWVAGEGRQWTSDSPYAGACARIGRTGALERRTCCQGPWPRVCRRQSSRARGPGRELVTGTPAVASIGGANPTLAWCYWKGVASLSRPLSGGPNGAHSKLSGARRSRGTAKLSPNVGLCRVPRYALVRHRTLSRTASSGDTVAHAACADEGACPEARHAQLGGERSQSPAGHSQRGRDPARAPVLSRQLSRSGRECFVRMCAAVRCPRSSAREAQLTRACFAPPLPGHASYR